MPRVKLKERLSPSPHHGATGRLKLGGLFFDMGKRERIAELKCRQPKGESGPAQSNRVQPNQTESNQKSESVKPDQSKSKFEDKRCGEIGMGSEDLS